MLLRQAPDLPRPRPGRPLIRLTAAVFVLFWAGAANALPGYQIVPLGFTDAEHTGDAGDQRSEAKALVGSAYVVGTSTRFDGADWIGQSAWLYDLSEKTTTRLGFFDAGHTNSATGQRNSSASFFTESGYIGGSSSRYDGSIYTGNTLWIYDRATKTTKRIGLFDAEHTDPVTGRQFSVTTGLTESGLAAGWSEGSGGAADRSAWFYDAFNDSTTRLGFTDALHTEATTDHQYSQSRLLTESGYVAGESRFYTADPEFGSSTWLYDSAAGTTIPVGLTDAEHTADSGLRSSEVAGLSESGLVAGFSNRYSGANLAGWSAWAYDSTDASQARLGYTDAAHTAPNGFQASLVDVVTDSGFVVGTSSRYTPDPRIEDAGQSSWFYDSTTKTTTRLGFYDAAHTGNKNDQETSTRLLTESGFAAGTSTRFNAGLEVGRSAWLYEHTSSTTTRLGFTDAIHTWLDVGYQDSYVRALTDSGYVTGYSLRFDGAEDAGLSAWLYDRHDDSTTRLGLFDADHRRMGAAPGTAEGYQRTIASFLTESGFVAGHSERFSGALPNGQTAWIYDAGNEEQFSIVLSENAFGTAFSQVSFLGEDGLALGFYRLYDTDDTWLGDRAFAWTQEDGAVDLGALLGGDLADAGWSYLADAIQSDGLQQIIGQGRLASGGDLAYLLAIPEPGTALLLGAGLGVLALRRRRR